MPSPFLVLDRLSSEVVYEADSLAQAKGFIDGHHGATIAAALLESHQAQAIYNVCLIDQESGQVVHRGPAVHLCDAADLLARLCMTLLPADEALTTELL